MVISMNQNAQGSFDGHGSLSTITTLSSWNTNLSIAAATVYPVTPGTF